jgi:hypothetical protein
MGFNEQAITITITEPAKPIREVTIKNGLSSARLRKESQILKN